MFWKTIGRWVLVAVAIPLAALGMRKLSERLEAKRGATRTTGLLRKSAEGLDWVSGRNKNREIANR